MVILIKLLLEMSCFYFFMKEILWLLFLVTKKLKIIQSFNSIFRCLDDLLNTDNTYVEGIVGQIYPSELQFNKACRSDTKALPLVLHLSILNGYVSSKIYDKRDDFDIVNFSFCLNGDIPRSIAYGVYKF